MALSREEKNARARARYAENPSKGRDKRRAYWQREDVKEQERARGRARYHANKEKFNAYSKAWKTASPDRVKAHADAKRFRAYGMTKEKFNEMFAEQGNRCKICGSDSTSGRHWHIDHCHETGAVRGILCQHCNLGIGHFKNNPELLIAAANYLRG